MNKTVLCIGDSLTTGFGVSPKDSWFSICKQTLPLFNWINKGINGDTISSMLCRLETDLKTTNASYVFIMGGSNDFLMNKDVDYVYDCLLMCLKDIINAKATPIIGIPPKCYGPSAKIFWDSYVDYSKFNTKVEIYRNDIIKLCQSKNIAYIDLSIMSPLEEKSYIDGLHPSKEFHSLISASFKSLITK